MNYIYALTLTKGKYYVGRTNCPTVRIDQHIQGEGAKWTSLYKPIEVLFVKPQTGVLDEDVETKLLMIKHGLDNVRGGSYCAKVLDDATYQMLQREIRTANNLCLKCGSKDHFANDCGNNNKKIKICKRCGRNTHTRKNCYALTKLDGSTIRTRKKKMI